MPETNPQQPLPPHEADRLAALRSLEILDTASEESFDELTALAASICQTPVALVSLVDEDRQWFKSRVGWTATATPRDVSFCAHTILQHDLLIVPDASADDRFANSPLVTSDPAIRFYAGAPLVTPEGHALGSLCVIDRRPRQLTAEQAQALRILSRQVMVLVQTRRYLAELGRMTRERLQAEQALAQERYLLHALMDNLPDNIYFKDAASRFLRINKALTKYFGLSDPGEAIGKTDFDFFTEEHARPAYEDEQHILRNGQPVIGKEEKETWLDGRVRWVSTTKMPLRGKDGTIIGTFGLAREITKLKLAEEALRENEERFRGTFENAAVGIAHTDLEGRWMRVNERFCAIFGYTVEELTTPGKASLHWQDLTYPEDLPASMKQLTALLAGERGSYSLEKRYVRKDGSVIWGQADISLVRDATGKPAYLIAVVQDISERKRLEAELRRALQAAEAANRAKDEFLANVSHEIRTPMNAILGMTELALEMEMTEDQRQCLKTVKSAADNLLGIINDLLDFAKIEAGKLELAPADFSLRAVVGDTLRALAVRAHKKGLELVYEVQPDVPDALVGDAGRLRQILLNLVGNAIKFTDAGEVEVSVGLESSGVATPGLTTPLRFTVRDTGIGIPKDKQERIFRAFEQEDTSTTRRYEGTGLGLTIASQLVALMGGTITVDSAPGRGSTFVFTVQLGRQPHQPEPTMAQPPVLLRDLPVLIVDDNATNRQILEGWLRGWQLKPAAVGDGLAALDALWHGAACGRPYALVLLDARMPNVDGLALAAQIRQRGELAATRLVLLTSGDRPGDLARAHELRVDAHLLKPVRPDELLQTIYRVMKKDEGRRMKDEPGKTPASDSSFILHPSSFPLRILVAEDNEFNAQLLEHLLVRRGHRVGVATNGREALEELQNADRRSQLAPQSAVPYDLLLLDIHMPELDGFQVVQAVRERERTAGGHLPIIALTARSRKEDRERCLAAGMDDFLAKPVQAADLWAAIDRLVSGGVVRGEGSESHGVATPGLATHLLDPQVLMAACGGEAVILERICQTFRAGLPDHLQAAQDALRDRDVLRLREAAHKLAGMVMAFSTVAGGVASNLEDRAAEGQLEEARPLVRQLETMADELIRAAHGLSFETLRRLAEAADKDKPDRQPRASECP
jgi:PAS domain S-box-containing protein